MSDLFTSDRDALVCSDEERRIAVAESTTHNGIDFVEIDAADQKIIHVGFIHPLPGQTGGIPASPALGTGNVVITGGVRIHDIHVTAVSANDRILTVTVASPGDFSPYTLKLVRSPADERTPVGFDPILSEQVFSFKVHCASALDCEVEPGKPAAASGPLVPIDYLARDFQSYRRQMLDRISNLVPGWNERNPADAMVTLVEVLAHLADRMAYRQDAVATEAYLGTARSRISVRRHARLLDYRPHDGVSARTWVHLTVAPNTDVVSDGLKAGSVLLTGHAEGVSIPGESLEPALAAGALAFETVDPLLPNAAHNSIAIHTWGGTRCRLGAGAMTATLVDPSNALTLAPGDFLLFEEIASPLTGRAVDADRARRHVVRITSVEASNDPVAAQDLVEIAWSTADALPFDLAITAQVAGGGGVGTEVVCTVARGNIVLAQHAMKVTGVLGPTASDGWRPMLTDGPIACAPARSEGGSDLGSDDESPAVDRLAQDPRTAVALVQLTTLGTTWEPRLDLLASDRFDRGFVVETERDGRSYLRFGDGIHGRRPPEGAEFTATWWAGGGRAGNLGANSLGCVVDAPDGVESLTNPVPARGGADPEDLEHVRQYAPAAFATPERAVTAADWVEVTRRQRHVQDAAARIRWTGSWWTVFVTVDLIGGRRLADEPELHRTLNRELDRYRIAGYDLELRDVVDVPVDLTLSVCIRRGVFRSDVYRGLVDAFAVFFDPDHFRFGQALHTSRILATAMTVPGVQSAQITALHPVGAPQGNEIVDGQLPVGDVEVIRLDNDPSTPEHGTLTIELDGGL